LVTADFICRTKKTAFFNQGLWNHIGWRRRGLGSWGAAKAIALFGGAKWFQSGHDKDTLQKAAAIAAGKPADPKAAAAIAGASPLQALAVATSMPTQ
jgi:hypothetical protein